MYDRWAQFESALKAKKERDKNMSEEKEVLTEEVFTPQAVEDFGMVGIEKLMGVLEGQEE
ncbi:Uncharacterised protein [[Eubacterium] contortum]|uniref:Uncharacterized protein n=1 Tax=Faecalicatena contorta TaxID=39482 RepID=A0A174K9J3_9FIRM|nr:hypothetical protein [Faecalicatena contorta]CUP06747.1 Uncharacterised protein [[Eubacterium] contortum] [Faecalicatena contorta]